MIGTIGNLFISLLLISPILSVFEDDTLREKDQIVDLFQDLSPNGNLSNPTLGYFTENKGQYYSDHTFCSYLSYGSICFSESKVVIFPNNQNEHDVDDPDTIRKGTLNILSYSFIGANDVSPVGVDKHSFTSNYFLGNDPNEWVTGVRSFKTVLYKGIWDGIDLMYQYNDQGLKYEFIIHPGGSTSDIKILVEGADSLNLQNGDLTVLLPDGLSISDSGLKVHYLNEPSVTIGASFHLATREIFSFKIDEYDHTRPIVIDPLLTSTYIGAGGEDHAFDQIMDGNLDMYITGKTSSALFPVQNDPYDPSYNQNWDAYVVKYDPLDSSIEFATFLGGGDYDCGMGIALNKDGEIIITGPTYSKGFPVSDGCYRPTHIGGEDIFITKLSPDGSTLLSSTYVGGTGRDLSNDILVDDTSSVYVTGFTESSDFPTSMDALNSSINGGEDIFILQMDGDLESIEYSSYFGGSGNDKALSMAMDDRKFIYLTGGSDSSNFPITTDLCGLSYNGIQSCFMVKINTGMSLLVTSTLIGGTELDEGTRIYLDENEDIYITGFTRSGSFPTTEMAYDTSYNGLKDAFIFKTDNSASTILYSTYLGGSKDDVGMDIGFDHKDRLFLSCTTESLDMPLVDPLYDDSHNGKRDSFLAVFNENGDSIYRSTYLGGGNDDETIGVSIDPDGNAYIVGNTKSGAFPTLANSYDDTHNIGMDIFVSVVNLSFPPSQPRDPTFSIGDGYIDISWDKPDMDGNASITGYKIYRRSDDVDEYSLISNTDALSFIDLNITNGITYLYYITSTNVAGESRPSSIITVSDEEAPTFLDDLTPMIGIVGRELQFSVGLVDNVRVSYAFVTYTHGQSRSVNLTRTEGDIWTCKIQILGSLDPIQYNFSCHDPSMNWAYTQVKTIQIMDDSLPIFIEDKTPRSCITGDPIDFKINVKDNIDISEVWVDYHSSSKPSDRGNISMEGSEEGYWTISIPTDHLITAYSYRFHAVDSSGNWNSTELEGLVQIIDSIDPIITNDTTPVSINMGASLQFTVEMIDNVEVSVAKVFYEVDGGEITGLDLIINGHYSATISVPMDPGLEIGYYFYVEDSSGNWVESGVKKITVIDSDPPNIIEDRTRINFTNGADFLFVLDVMDDDGIDKVLVEYWFGNGSHQNTLMVGPNPYTLNIRIGTDQYQDLTYIFHCEDMSGNINTTLPKVITAPVQEVEDKKEKGNGPVLAIVIVCIIVVLVVIAILLIVLTRKKPTDDTTLPKEDTTIATQEQNEDPMMNDGTQGIIGENVQYPEGSIYDHYDQNNHSYDDLYGN